MDPVLQVRLCVSCRDQECVFVAVKMAVFNSPPTGFNFLEILRIVLYLLRLVRLKYTHLSVSLLYHRFVAILPQKGRQSRLCCLRKDWNAYLREYNAARQADGPNAVFLWTQKRKREVIDRLDNARPLIEFIKAMEEEQSDDLATRKVQRQEEVESRLLKLGWENGDFTMREKTGTKQWKSLVCIAKPLTERDWDKILPQLNILLEHNRKLRLEQEASARKSTRQSATWQWLHNRLCEMEPYARVVEDDQSENISQAQEDLYLTLKYTEELKSANKNLKAPYPSINQVIAWDPFKLLVDTDVPMEDFELRLAGIRPTLDTLLLEWRTNLEKDLIKLLPANTNSIVSSLEAGTSALRTQNAVDLRSVPEVSILVGGESATSLPSDTRKLLRADTIFHRIQNIVHYYPDNFAPVWSTPTDTAVWRFNVEASKVARVLLVALGNVDATYLQLKAAGPAFSCGRCATRNCVTWREMISHFVRELEKWAFFRENVLVKTGKLTYIFTHNIEATYGMDPIVRMASEDDMKTPYRFGWGKVSCMICAPVRSIDFESVTGVVDHVRNVHLVPDPEKGQHYREW
ncbi:hypothetical protein FRC09_013878 [Ceratobasidium sp. 395]|nr:hypothetical protein FRC09_013878 [Ceratobasidium sp. 395]